MLGVGWTEMLLIGVVALIVIGPKDLPVVMNRIGKVIGSIRRMGGEFQREINKSTGLDQVTDLRRSITEPLKKTAAEITREFNRTTPSGTVVPSGAIVPKDPKVESVVDEIHQSVGLAIPAAAVMTSKVESPAPVEAIAPVAKPARKPRAKAVVPASDGPLFDTPAPRKRAAKKAVAEPAPAEAVAAASKPVIPRKPRAAKPKPEA